MSKTITVVDIGYTHAENVNDYKKLMSLYEAGSGHHHALTKHVNLHVIRHLNQETKVEIENTKYYFLRGSKSRFWLPFRLHRFINTLKPDIILLHGFLNPLQVLLLSFQTKAILVIQDHGGGVPGGLKTLIQRLVKFLVNDYIFTAVEQAEEFIRKGLITKGSHIYEVMEGSTHKKRIDKNVARQYLKWDQSKKIFLWVGRLDENKDPITVLNGFEKLLSKNNNFMLYLIYGEENLLKLVQEKIAQSSLLKNSVKLIGKLPHEMLDWYYSASDYFVLGSHHEGSGYALCEALACGCIPVVTNIPSFKKMTNNGAIGSLWEPSSVISLIEALNKVLTMDNETESQNAMQFFEQKLSFHAIARSQFENFEKIIARRFN